MYMDDLKFNSKAIRQWLRIRQSPRDRAGSVPFKPGLMLLNAHCVEANKSSRVVTEEFENCALSLQRPAFKNEVAP
jgi:hypothetical protein